jgi:hypothetical protein
MRRVVAFSLTPPRRPLPSRSAVTYLAYLTLVGLVGGYGVFLVLRANAAYSFLKGDRLGFRGKVHQADPELGFAAIPLAAGFHVFPIGPPMPMRYDADGFRIPDGRTADATRPRPLVLALGCSFTYGDSTRAEQTWPHLVASDLGGTELNAGKCAYGLAQMLLLARKLIPRYRPDYVLVQFSTWLPGRGTSGFARATFGNIPVPSLLLGPDGEVGVQPPAFKTAVFELPFHEFDNKRRGAGEFMRFFFRAAAPLFARDDLNMAAYQLKRGLGRFPADELDRARRNREELNRVVYKEIGRVAADHAAQMVIVRLSHPLEKDWQRLKELSPGALVVNAQVLLDAHVPSRKPEDYYKLFGHWRGSPPRLVDTHPNPAAHRVIADAVLRAIKAGSPKALTGTD